MAKYHDGAVSGSRRVVNVLLTVLLALSWDKTERGRKNRRDAMILVCAAVLLLVGYNAYVVCVLLLPVFVRAYMVTFSPLLTTLFSWSPFRFTYLPLLEL